MSIPRISLEQWAILQTIVDEGSFANAAAKLHRSQSTLSYNIKQLQAQLGVELLTIKGRKAQLTDLGQQLVNRSRHLTRLANDLEAASKVLTQSWEREITFMVDDLYPKSLLFKAIKHFADLAIPTRLIIKTGILSGPMDAIAQGEVDLAITSFVPKGMIGTHLFDSISVAYAHQDHFLHTLDRPLMTADLQEQLYIIVMDSGTKDKMNVGWHGSENQWKVDSMEMKLQMIANGIGFSWLPKHLVEERNLPLKPLLLAESGQRIASLYLVHRAMPSLSPALALLSKYLTQNL